MVTTTPLERKRCPLCLAILEIVRVHEGRSVHLKFDGHTAESCERATAARIRVLEEMHIEDSRQIQSQSMVIDDLSRWIGVCAKLMTVGKTWIDMRLKRMADLTKLRQAFGTGEREHPLWTAEREVAEALQKAIDRVELGST